MLSSNSAALNQPSSSPAASSTSAYTTSILPVASTRIIDGSGVMVTLSNLPITSATMAPTWLFINVKPHMLDAVLSCLNGLSAVLKVLTEVTGPAPSVLADPDRTG